MAKQAKSDKRKRPSMQDVADLAGVSKTTVSFVINDVPGSSIPPKTRERVREAVRKLDYRPNVMARSLRSKRSHAIGFISDRVATTPYAGLMIQGAQDAAWAKGMILLLANTEQDPAIEKATVSMMLDRQVDGIIYAAWYHRPVKPQEEMFEVPVVLADCYVKDRSLPSVVPDEVEGGRRATEALLQKGHRRIGMINNLDLVPATSGRLQGYQDALARHRVSFDPSLVCAGVSMAEGGYRCALELMQLPNPPTALFCFNDRMAMGAYDALRRLNLSIPEDVSIIGFDNQVVIASNLYPPLSTMELPHYQMGVWAAKHLIGLTQGSVDKEPIQHMVECPFVERASI